MGRDYVIGKGRLPSCCSCNCNIVSYDFVFCVKCRQMNHIDCLRLHDGVCMGCLRKYDCLQDYHEYMDREPSCDIWEPHQRFKSRFGTSVVVEKYGPWMLFWIDRCEPKPVFIRTPISPINMIEEIFNANQNDSSCVDQ